MCSKPVEACAPQRIESHIAGVRSSPPAYSARRFRETAMTVQGTLLKLADASEWPLSPTLLPFPPSAGIVSNGREAVRYAPPGYGHPRHCL